MWGLPDLKSAFTSSLTSCDQDNVKEILESKSQEYKALLQENFTYSQRTQQALIAIAFSLLLILTIAYFWTN